MFAVPRGKAFNMLDQGGVLYIAWSKGWRPYQAYIVHGNRRHKLLVSTAIQLICIDQASRIDDTESRRSKLAERLTMYTVIG